jgi:hypothetical protein
MRIYQFNKETPDQIGSNSYNITIPIGISFKHQILDIQKKHLDLSHFIN